MDRIERHDIINALVLAIVLLLMALLLSLFTGRLFSTVDEGLIDKESTEDTSEAPTTVSSSPTTTEPTTTTEPALPPVHAPASVKVIVANSARVSGIATLASDTLRSASYNVQSPTNGDTIPIGVVYYVDGYEQDAVQVANLLGMSPEAIAVMPESLSFAPGEAHLAAVIGEDQTLK